VAEHLPCARASLGGWLSAHLFLRPIDVVRGDPC
jgi:hypothetical protein